MFVINVDQHTKLETIEVYYTRLDEAKKLDIVVDVLLPKELTHHYLGVIPAIIQFIITWIRYKKAGSLLIDITDTSQDSLDDLYKNELIFPAVLLAWNKTGVFTKDRKSLRGILNAKNREFMEKMQAGKSIPGHKLLLADFDHYPDDLLLPCFGDRYKFVGTKATLRTSIKDGIADVFFYFPDVHSKFESNNNDFISIVFELMKNTFEWAREDQNGVPITPNIRGILIKFFKKRRASFLDDYKNHKGLHDFFSSDRFKENEKKELYFIEISAFDGGAGFVKKYYSNNPDIIINNEIDIIKTCLIKHQTSASGMEKDDKGIGLDEILTILDNKGFIRIKTGTSCVYRNLITHPYHEVKNSEQMVLYDWKTNSENNFTKFKESEGALLTIIYPLAIDGSK